MSKTVEKREKRAKRPKKRVEEVVQYAIGHRTRVQILIHLNEGIYTANELAEEIDEPLNNLYSHLGKMLEDGSIEIADTKTKGNMTQNLYKAVEIQEYSVEDFERLPFVYRQHIVAAISQSGMAEVLAALYAGKLADPRATIFWDWLNLDAKGRQHADALTEEYVEKMRTIEVEATNRVAKTKEQTTSMLLNTSFFERAKKGESPEIRKGRSATVKWPALGD